MYFPFMTLYFSDILGKGTAGMLMTIPPLLGIIGSLIGGHLTDKWGRRPSMLLGSFIQTAMFALFALSISPWVDYLAFIGVGIGGSIYSPASLAMVADLIPQKERRKIFATFVTAKNIGAVFGPALGSVLFFHHREGLLWTCTLVTFIYSIAIYKLISETLPKTTKKTEQFNTIIPIMKEQWKGYAEIFRDKAFVLYIMAGIFVTIAFMQLDLYLAVYVNEYVPSQTLFTWKDWSLKLSSAEVFGWMLGLNGLLFVIGVLPVTKWFENRSDRNTLILSSVLFGLGMSLIGFNTNVWLLFIFTVILTVGEVIRSPVAQSFVSNYAPENARGQYMGASNLQYSIGRFFAPLSVVISTWMPSLAVFGILVFCLLISVSLYIILFQMIASKTQKKKESTIGYN
jgi:MFS family permease